MINSILDEETRNSLAYMHGRMYGTLLSIKSRLRGHAGLIRKWSTDPDVIAETVALGDLVADIEKLLADVDAADQYRHDALMEKCRQARVVSDEELEALGVMK